MKEKHQMLTNGDGNVNSIDENEKTCSFCQTNSVHPRLSRGEQYPCGFKPYRCDLCLYSTTTKGNLAIHMQSDKHLNNCKDISSPSNSSDEQFVQSQGLIRRRSFYSVSNENIRMESVDASLDVNRRRKRGTKSIRNEATAVEKKKKKRNREEIIYVTISRFFSSFSLSSILSNRRLRRAAAHYG